MDHKESPDITLPSERNKVSVTDPKEIKIYGLPDNSKELS